MINCRICKEDKSFDNFYKTKRYKTGYMPVCRSCESKRKSAYNTPEVNKNRYLKNREVYLKRQKEYTAKNKDKIKVRSRKYYENNRDIFLQAGWKQKGIKNKEGLFFTLIDFEKAIKNCNSKCQICGSDGSKHKKGLVVDHDHITGIYRGILCAFCNTAIGYLKDDPKIIKKAINYISKNK